jgi:two-component system, cell cycle sensor histidine kinase PleC
MPSWVFRISCAGKCSDRIAYKDYAGDIYSSGHYLLTLINDILDLSRIEAGRRELCEEPLALAASLRDAVRMIEAPLNEKSITLAIEIDGNFPKLMGDRRALHQIWLNLLSNALKFTPVDGRIEIAVEQIPRTASLCISWTMDPEFQHMRSRRR